MPYSDFSDLSDFSDGAIAGGASLPPMARHAAMGVAGLAMITFGALMLALAPMPYSDAADSAACLKAGSKAEAAAISAAASAAAGSSTKPKATPKATPKAKTWLENIFATASSSKKASSGAAAVAMKCFADDGARWMFLISAILLVVGGCSAFGSAVMSYRSS